MKKQYISPVCEVVAVNMEQNLMAASGPATKMSIGSGDDASTSDITTSADDDNWAGSKGIDLGWDD